MGSALRFGERVLGKVAVVTSDDRCPLVVALLIAAVLFFPVMVPVACAQAKEKERKRK